MSQRGRSNTEPIAMMTLDQDDTMSSCGDSTANLSGPQSSYPSSMWTPQVGAMGTPLPISASQMSRPNTVDSPAPPPCMNIHTQVAKTPQPPQRNPRMMGETGSPVVPEMPVHLREMMAQFAPAVSLPPVLPQPHEVISAPSSEDNSPAIPECMSTYQDKLKQRHTGNNSDDNSPVPPPFMTQQQLSNSNQDKNSPILPVFLKTYGDSNESSPVPPEEVPTALKQIFNPEEREVGPAPVLRRVDIEDQELPQVPELDVTVRE